MLTLFKTHYILSAVGVTDISTKKEWVKSAPNK